MDATTTTTTTPTKDEEAEEKGSSTIQREEVWNRRLIRCMILLLILWFVMLYFIAENDNALMIAGLVIFGLWVIYMCMCIFGGNGGRCLRGDRQRPALEPVGRDEEERRLTSKFFKRGGGDKDSLTDDDDDIEQDTKSSIMSIPFEETLERIKKCPYHVSPDNIPTNGLYTVVFSSVFMGKPIRNEGKIKMEFFQTRDNGWTIEGESMFFSMKNTPIEDGFVNSRGDMYWKIGPTLYRGQLDFVSSTMFDGEFMTTDTRLLSIQNMKPPVGRIVRLELAKASFYSSSVEMFSFSSNGRDDDDNDDDDEKNNEDLIN